MIKGKAQRVRRFFGRPPALPSPIERDYLTPWTAAQAQSRYLKRFAEVAHGEAFTDHGNRSLRLELLWRDEASREDEQQDHDDRDACRSIRERSVVLARQLDVGERDVGQVADGIVEQGQ